MNKPVIFLAILLLAVAALPVANAQQAGTRDPNFFSGSGIYPYGHIRKAVIAPGNQILIGGEFYSYNTTTRYRIARLQSSGVIDGAFNPGSGPNEIVYAVELQSDGKILIGGEFTTYNGTASRGIARLLTNGTRDTGFNVGTGFTNNPNIRVIKVQPDGKILVGGDFNGYNGTPVSCLVRLNPDGTRDTGFNFANAVIAITSTVRDLIIQPDGKIIVGGESGIVRIKANGALDPSFAYNTTPVVFCLAALPDGKIYVGGQFSTYSGNSRNNIARLNADGSLDQTFNPGSGADFDVYSIVVQPDGKLVLAGWFTTYNGVSRNSIVRVMEDGTLDTTFNPGTGADGPVYSIAMQTTGRLILVGYHHYYNGVQVNRITRVFSNWVINAGSEYEESELVVYPNPVNRTVYLDLPQNGQSSMLKLTAITGKTVVTKAITGGGLVTLNLDQLPAGTYLLQVLYSDKVLTQKLVIQN